MKLKKLMAGISLATLVALGTNTASQASVIVLDFEGVADNASINDFYNGGTDSAGNSGIDYGINFSNSALGLVDGDSGGGGNFANEPSADTIMFFSSADSAILNFAAGFDTGFSFFYSAFSAATVNVYDSLDGLGNLLASLNLDMNYNDNGCVGDPTGQACNWDAIGVNFSGIAKSIDFGGSAGSVGFDNITFGTAEAQKPASVDVAEPGLLGIFGLGLMGLATFRRRKSV